MSEKTGRLKLKLGTMTTRFQELGAFPKINAPSEKFNVYEASLRLDQDYLTELEALLEAKRDEAMKLFKKEWPKKAARLKLGRLPLAEEVDREGAPTGKTLLRTRAKAGGERRDGSKWTFKPVVKNSSGDIVKSPPPIWGGSTVRLALTICGYLGNTDNTVGVSLELDGVQVKKLVSGGGRDTSGLGAVEDDEDGDNWTGAGADESANDGAASDDTDF